MYSGLVIQYHIEQLKVLHETNFRSIQRALPSHQLISQRQPPALTTLKVE